MAVSKRIKSALEALMYIWGEPLEPKDAAEACDITREEAKDGFYELQKEYDQEGRGLMIRQVGKGFQFATRPENADYIEKLCTPVKTRKLSQAALEVLAIIAYKQPVTKSEIDGIRGIKCDRIIEGLEKKELIKELGRSSGIGRPILYGTTDTFLKKFGFTTLKELPEIEDIEDILAADDRDYDLPTDLQMSLDDVGGLEAGDAEVGQAEDAAVQEVEQAEDAAVQEVEQAEEATGQEENEEDATASEEL